MALNLLEGFDLRPEDPWSYHVQIEAMRLALADTYRFVADPRHMELAPEAFLSKPTRPRGGGLLGRGPFPGCFPGSAPRGRSTSRRRTGR